MLWPAIEHFIDNEIRQWEDRELIVHRQQQKRARKHDIFDTLSSSEMDLDEATTEVTFTQQVEKPVGGPQRKKKNKKLTVIDDYLTAEDWALLVQYKEILLPLWEAIMRLQGVAVKGHNGALWEVLPMYQYILDHLYKFDAKYTTDEPTY
ncbi:MAG: hypothetical protein M1839_005303 [Geoglossum umbratile]|nr:MAG: hypothetical protein M1839_005303 [Geoglossum umbratile]